MDARDAILAIACLSPPAALAAAETPLRGGTVVVAVIADPGHLNPAITTASNVHAVADSLFNGLVALDRELRPVPNLAESWTVSDDNSAYTFRLAPDVHWHDGMSV